ncbi:MAG: hypothetical protein AAF431_14710 [Pseudomonadota bacterium]
MPKLAQQDQIWTQTWHVLQQGLSTYLNQAAGSTITEELAASSDLEEDTIRLFLRYALSYGRPTLGPARVQYRYPHYNLAELENDFELLTERRLLERSADKGMFAISDSGARLLENYWQLRKMRANALPAEIKAPFAAITPVLKKVVIGATLMDGGNNTVEGAEFSSINWRHKSWQSQADQLDQVSQAQESYADYTAFNNDNAHYRFDRAPHVFEETKPLGPIAKELFAGMRSGRTRSVDYCTSHSRWRQPHEACEQAFANLLKAGLIELSDADYRQSSKGLDVFKRAQDLADKRFYQPWAVLTVDEYQNYKSAISMLESLLIAPPSSAP